MGADAPRPKAEPSSNMSHVQKAAPNLRLIDGGQAPAATLPRRRRCGPSQKQINLALASAKGSGLVIREIIIEAAQVRLVLGEKDVGTRNPEAEEISAHFAKARFRNAA